MTQSQWKAYFSMFVLGQTDPIWNSTISMDEWYCHQSCPWLAIVANFQMPNNCWNCTRPCKGGYCQECTTNPCWECGEVSCGGYCVYDRCPIFEGGRGDIHKSCRRSFR